RKIPVGRYCATGMNGGRIFLRCDEISDEFSETFFGTKATQSNLAEIRPYLNEFCKLFDVSLDFVMSKDFYLLEASMHTH
ncbi:MAG: glutamate synthase, partial [Oscillospiraceae bacterium]